MRYTLFTRSVAVYALRIDRDRLHAIAAIHQPSPASPARRAGAGDDEIHQGDPAGVPTSPDADGNWTFVRRPGARGTLNLAISSTHSSSSRMGR